MIKRAFICFFAIAAAFTVISTAAAQVRTVGAGERYPTIQLAVEAAEPGDVIQIKPGTYFSLQPVVIAYKDRLTILGQAGVHIMTPNIFRGSDYLPVVAILHSSNIAVSSLHAMHDRQPAWGSGCGGPVIFAENSSNVSIEACELNGSGAIGIQAVGVTDLTVKNNYIHNNSHCALELRNCAAVSIRDNKIINNGQVMNKTNVDNLEMLNNTLTM